MGRAAPCRASHHPCARRAQWNFAVELERFRPELKNVAQRFLTSRRFSWILLPTRQTTGFFTYKERE